MKPTIYIPSPLAARIIPQIELCRRVNAAKLRLQYQRMQSWSPAAEGLCR